MNKYTRGKTLHSQTREVISNVYNVCEEESENNTLLVASMVLNFSLNVCPFSYQNELLRHNNFQNAIF